MAKLIMNKGLPASGKSTWAMKTVGNGKANIRLNRDDLRAMLYGSQFSFTRKKEDYVIACQKAMAAEALAKNLNVIIDDTNLGERNKNMWGQFAKDHNSKFEVNDMTNVEVDVCVMRDKLRAIKGEKLSQAVGRAVIERMALWHGLLPDLRKGYEKIVFFDIDGTLADGSHRYYLTHGHQKDWVHFKRLAPKDKLDHTIAKWFHACKEDYTVFIMSGRDTREGLVTEGWLEKHWIKPERLFVRQWGDSRDDRIVKEEMLHKVFDRYGKENVLFAVDDRPRVVQMWRDNGIKVYPVNQHRWEERSDG